MGFYNVVNRSLLAAGQPEDISQVLANLDAIATVLNGGIDSTNIADGSIVNADIAAGAAIALSKIAGPVLLGVRVLAGSGNYVPTSGTRAIFVECIGGGGGGGGTSACTAAQNSLSGGASGGGYAAKFIAAPLAANYAYVVGAGGAGGAAPAGNGVNGTDTSFGGGVVLAKGGAGGIGLAAFAPPIVYANPAPGQAGNVGDITLLGGMSTLSSSFGTPNQGTLPSQGGSGARGGSGGIVQSGVTGPGNNLLVPNVGGGGSGAITLASAAAQVGGAGAAGIIVVWEFA